MSSNAKTAERLDEDDADALASLPETAPPRKTGQQYSYSHQLRTNTGTHIQRNPRRKHSLDDSNIADRFSCDDSSDDEFYPYASSAGIGIGPPGTAPPLSNPHPPPTPGSTTTTTTGGDSTNTTNNNNNINNDDPQTPMAEFAAAGGEAGIFKVPCRAAVHPGRPPCLELRPHPLRETQVGKFLRTIACTETQLWAGLECGVRFWNFSDSYEPGIGIGGRARRGDEDAAPFYESVNTSPTTCLVIDCGSKLVWTGHKDGKIRSWKMDSLPPNDDSPFKEGLSWQAHRGPILSMVISSYGDIWAGFEGGLIKVWPWESIEKSLSLSPEERHMAALLVERSFIDLKSQVTVNGVCNISSSDVKFLLSDHVRGKVWAAGSLSFSLWDARSRELLKVYNVEGQIENRADASPGQEQPVEDEMNVKFVSKSKKEKSQGSFLQRSRNAIIGAADAVRRVATKGAGAFAEQDSKKTEALVLTCDGMIWTGCSNGLLIQWDGSGNRLQDFHHHQCAVLCFCAYGSRLWIGYVSGMVQVMDLEGNLVAGWIAHNGPIIRMVAGNGSIYSLATHGGIRGWYISSPGPLDNIIRPELAKKELTYTTHENVKIMVGTWNVGQGKPAQDALTAWLGSQVSDIGILVVGLQEVEMGAGFLAMSVGKEIVGLEGSSIGQWWQDAIGKSLDEGTTFERVGSRQLAGLLIAIWVRKSLRTHVGDLDVAAVACGLGRAVGNKGGVGLRLRVYDRIMCFVNCHLAAHLEAVNRRNADFDHIFKTMVFSRSANNASAGVSSTAQMLRANNAAGITPEDGKPDLAEADMVIFCGDFNYRLFGITYDEARDFVSQRSFDWLREKDQLRAEMKAGKVFQGMREALIRFPPTYKFERGKPGLGGYDSGEKKRIPAWCDRVLYRDSRFLPTSECSLECPVVASIFQYEACMEVTESDHKPVRCKFNVQLSRVDRSARRQEFGKIWQSNDKLRALREELSHVPETAVSTDNIVLQNQETSSLTVTNKSGKDEAFFQILCEGQSTIKPDEQADYRPRGSHGFPRWLEVTPAIGMLKSGQTAEISVRHEESHTLEDLVDGGGVPQSWWSEDTRDKEVVLSVIIRGNGSTETKSHRVHVRHSFTGKNTVRMDSKGHSTSKKYQSSSSGQQRTCSKTQTPANSNPSDVVDDRGSEFT